MSPRNARQTAGKVPPGDERPESGHGEESRPCGRKGADNWAAKLTAEDVALIRALLDSGAEGKKLAGQFGVTPSAISAIRKRKVWAHV